MQWVNVQHTADKGIKMGEVTPMIIVMPNAGGEKRGYSNDPAGEWRYEDFFFDEFISYIEKTYRIKSEQRFRTIGGLSMGGGLLLCAASSRCILICMPIKCIRQKS